MNDPRMFDLASFLAPTDTRFASDREELKNLQSAWKVLIEEEPERFAPLLDHLLDQLSAAVTDAAAVDLPKLSLCFRAVSKDTLLEGYRTRTVALTTFKERAPRFIDHVAMAVGAGDGPTLLPGPSGINDQLGGIFTEVMDMIRCYTRYDDTVNRVGAAQLVPAFLRAFPKADSDFLTGFIKDHPEPEAAIVEILHDCLERHDLDAPMIERIAREMLGLYADRSDLHHEARCRS